MTKEDILKNLETQMADLYYDAKIARFTGDKRECLKALREAEAVCMTGIRLLSRAVGGDPWVMRMSDARRRAIEYARTQFEKRHDDYVDQTRLI